MPVLSLSAVKSLVTHPHIPFIVLNLFDGRLYLR